MSVQWGNSPVKARVELAEGMWWVRIVRGEAVLKERYFRRGCKATALSWASEQVYLATKEGVEHV